jgi:hypothetical protein
MGKAPITDDRRKKWVQKLIGRLKEENPLYLNINFKMFLEKQIVKI